MVSERDAEMTGVRGQRLAHMPSTATEAGRRLALILYGGEIGGTEVFYVNLAAALRRIGVAAELLFVRESGRLAERLELAGVPFRELRFARGRDVIVRPRRFAREAMRSGRDGVLLPDCGYMGVALRLGGFRAPIVAVEHGTLFYPAASRLRRALHLGGRVVGARAAYVNVAVSDFMLEHMRSAPHARRIRRIYNGVDTSWMTPLDPGSATAAGLLEVAFAGTLKPGKGVVHAIGAVAQMKSRVPVRLRIAGDGPDGPRLRSLAEDLSVATEVEFLGLISDVRGLWQQCDVAIFPSDSVESFGMSAVEALACGKPVIATSNGGTARCRRRSDRRGRAPSRRRRACERADPLCPGPRAAPRARRCC